MKAVDYSEFQPFIGRVLKTAADIAVTSFGMSTAAEVTIKANDSNQVLTEIDMAIGRYLIAAIERAFPAHSIIDEEAGVIAKNSAFTWAVDPIDGTSNFAAGVPTYGILLGLLHGNTAVAGGLVLPSFGQVITASKRAGAHCDGKRLSVSNEQKLQNSLVAYGIDSHPEKPGRTRAEAALLAEVLLAARNVRISNSAFDYAQVATGAYGAVLNQTNKIWDNVALQVVLEEAGALVTDISGQLIDYGRPLERAGQNFTFCAAAPELHHQLQSVIRPYL